MARCFWSLVVCAALLGAIVGARFSGATARELDGLARRLREVLSW